jgi:hypothetical protein
MELKDCFKEDFIVWLSSSNHPKIKPYITHQSKLNIIVEESLQEILDILLIHPEADYFWYGYPEHGGKLSYTVPSSRLRVFGYQPVPGDSLRVDKEKIKAFLRDYKIRELLK